MDGITKPIRIQLSRAKGWRMPENTVKVDASTKWGNPFVKHGDGYQWEKGASVRALVMVHFESESVTGP